MEENKELEIIPEDILEADKEVEIDTSKLHEKILLGMVAVEKVLFGQAANERTRLANVTNALNRLEDDLFSSETMDMMTIEDKMFLFNLATKAKNNSQKFLLELHKTAANGIDIANKIENEKQVAKNRLLQKSKEEEESENLSKVKKLLQRTIQLRHKKCE